MQACAQYQSALHFFPPQKSTWKPRTLMCSSIEKTGLPEIWGNIENYMQLCKDNGFFNNQRQEQTKYWMYETINEALRNNFYDNKDILACLPHYEQEIANNKISSFVAAKKLLEKYFDS
jgi:LAO/AO transport system kinase